MEQKATPKQLEICHRFCAEVVPPNAEEKLGIALSSLNKVPLHAVRGLAINGTCVWYIWGGEYSPDPDFYQPLHVAHIAEYCPQIHPYLALAPGWSFILAPGYEDVWFDPENLVE